MRIAETAPAYCSSCFTAQVEMQHVDMETAWDGPVLDGEGRQYVIDDLILCASCVRAANRLLPESLELQAENDALRRQYAQAVDYAAQLARTISAFEKTVSMTIEAATPRAPARTRAAGPKVAV